MNIIPQTISVVSDSDPMLELPQMWKCSRCGKNRQWGLGPSLEPKLRPFLTCKCRNGHVRHSLVGLRAS